MDRIALFESAPSFTLELLTQYYARNFERFLNILDENVVWIGPLKQQIAYGRTEVESFLRREKEIIFQLTDSKFELAFCDRNSCVVVGRMELCMDEERSHALKCKQRASLVFKVKDERLRVIHMHISESWDIFDKEAFPFRLSTQTYDHMRQCQKNRHGRDNKLTVYDTKRRVHFILESEIIYIESSNIYCQLFCVNGSILAAESISRFEERLSGRFVRVHRSFIINVDYVIGMERFALRLCDGISIPVPEKKYVKLRDEISVMQLLASSGQT